jgi:hypothetical protein
MGSLQNVAPVFDYLDTDNLVNHIKDVLGIPAKILRSKSEVQQIRAEQQQQMMQQQQMQQDMQTAEIANKAAPLAKVLSE